jgi:hypothetical protein
MDVSKKTYKKINGQGTYKRNLISSESESQTDLPLYFAVIFSNSFNELCGTSFFDFLIRVSDQ